MNRRIGYLAGTQHLPLSSDAGARAEAGGRDSFSLTSSTGWYSSQKTYLLRYLERVDAGIHVRVALVLLNEQHGDKVRVTEPCKLSRCSNICLMTIFVGVGKDMRHLLRS
ncbi:hypothetical protein SAY87_008300 [Trapa incisa]|uniref:Uncharacterized protein n=1 Tax=Trapa incisa TaxID=236973 RepID=A0AAN7KL28_9MYRT|nr:hypothetical protein SAY87_008300 [Trapa incisa]